MTAGRQRVTRCDSAYSRDKMIAQKASSLQRKIRCRRRCHSSLQCARQWSSARNPPETFMTVINQVKGGCDSSVSRRWLGRYAATGCFLRDALASWGRGNVEPEGRVARATRREKKKLRLATRARADCDSADECDLNEPKSWRNLLEGRRASPSLARSEMIHSKCVCASGRALASGSARS